MGEGFTIEIPVTLFGVTCLFAAVLLVALCVLFGYALIDRYRNIPDKPRRPLDVPVRPLRPHDLAKRG
jgi:hypothetical protein